LSFEVLSDVEGIHLLAYGVVSVGKKLSTPPSRGPKKSCAVQEDYVQHEGRRKKLFRNVS